MEGMKRILVPLILAGVTVFAGCDMFRKLAGRPTQEELMRMEQMVQEEKRHQARIDSLDRLRQAKEDSIAIMDSLMQIKGTILNPSEVGGLFTTKLDSKYYVVVGAFKNRNNAEDLFDTVSERGYKPILISFRNGFNAIAMCPTNSVQEAFASLKRVRSESFCPDDVWILVNE